MTNEKEKHIFNEIKKILGNEDADSIDRIMPDGSERLFYRISRGRRSYIAVSNTEPGTGNSTDENRTYIYVQSILRNAGVNVPEIMGCSDDRSVILLEDLGEINMQEYLRKGKNDKGIIDDILEAIYRIGRIESVDPEYIFSHAYDSDFIFNEECCYFYNHFAVRFSRDKTLLQEMKDELKRLACRSEGFLYRGFMHRDLQSRNIIIRDNSPFLIDFQGARMGHRAYDFASFIFDAYTDLYPVYYEYITDRITGIMKSNNEGTDQFFHEFRYVSIYRLLQMMGAYCNLYYNKGKEFFGQYIRTAYERLSEFLKTNDIDGTEVLELFLERIKMEGL